MYEPSVLIGFHTMALLLGLKWLVEGKTSRIGRRCLRQGIFGKEEVDLSLKLLVSRVSQQEMMNLRLKLMDLTIQMVFHPFW